MALVYPYKNYLIKVFPKFTYLTLFLHRLVLLPLQGVYQLHYTLLYSRFLEHSLELRTIVNLFTLMVLHALLIMWLLLLNAVTF